MMTKKDWLKGIDAWTNIKKQAELDLEQANLYIETIQQKIKEMK